MAGRFRLVLVLLVAVLGLFMGCDSNISTPVELNIPTLVDTLQGYSNEITSLVYSHICGKDPKQWDGTFVVAEGISCRVTSQDIDELELTVKVDTWVASDGAQVSGLYEEFAIKYDTAYEYYYRIISSPTLLYTGNTAISFLTTIWLREGGTLNFSTDWQDFICISLSVDGRSLIENPWLTLKV